MKTTTVTVTRTYFKSATVDLLVEDDFNPETDDLSEENWSRIENRLAEATLDGGEDTVTYENYENYEN